MSRALTTSEWIRMILILAVVFLGMYIFGYPIISAPVATVLVYFVLAYRRKIRVLEGQGTLKPLGAAGSVPPAESGDSTPSSTDA
jgi:hypothetical protein